MRDFPLVQMTGSIPESHRALFNVVNTKDRDVRPSAVKGEGAEGPEGWLLPGAVLPTASGLSENHANGVRACVHVERGGRTGFALRS